MASNYEKRWPKLRLEWGAEKIQEWQKLLNDEKRRAERRKLKADITRMKLALEGWQKDKRSA